MTDLVANLARSKGLPVDEKAASDRRTLTRGQFFSPLNMLERLDVPGTPDTPLLRSVRWPTPVTRRTVSRTVWLPT
jgi:hypothetical protein